MGRFIDQESLTNIEKSHSTFFRSYLSIKTSEFKWTEAPYQKTVIKINTVKIEKKDELSILLIIKIFQS